MKLLFALGNPEPRYNGTRHNVGFTMLDSWTNGHNGQFTQKTKFKAEVAEVSANGEKVLCAKPTTYYNEVGQSLRALMDFYHIEPQDILVLHDDLALPLGTLRTRVGGSGGGNNGIKSINTHGGEATHRLRIGIWSELRDRIDDADFVLSRFSSSEQKIMDEFRQTILATIDHFIDGNHASTTHRHSM